MQKRERRGTASPESVRDLPVSTALDLQPVQPGRLPVTWEGALAAWLQRLNSAGTRSTYGSAVHAFFSVRGAPALNAPDLVAALDAYAGALRMRVDASDPRVRLAPATMNVRLAAMRSFLGFCRKRGWLFPSITGELIADALQDMPSTVQKPYQIIEGGDELRAMLNAAAADTWDAPRCVALVALGLGAGLRVAELVSLDVCDLASDTHGCYVDVRCGKGRKQRQVGISADVYEMVAAYLAATGRAVYRTADRNTPLFLSGGSTQHRLAARQARRVIKACAERAGFTDASGKHITPHSLRHSYAISLLMGDPETGRPGAPLPAVSKLLGHSSIAVTGRYLNHDDRRTLAQYAPSLRQHAASN